MFNLKSIVLGAAVVFATSITLSSCVDKEKVAREKAMADSVRVADSMAMVEAAAKVTSDSLANLPKSIADLATANPDLSSLVGALGTAELVETLKGGSFTVFAPNNAAFEAAKADVAKVSADKMKLGGVLKLHVVEGPALKTADLTDGKELTTMTGEKIKVMVGKDGKIMVGGAELVGSEMTASNGSVFVISKVLMPSKKK